MRLYLVRHADVVARPERPGPQWHLSPEGRAAAEALAEEPYWEGARVLHTSPEPKAAGTAQRIAARHGLPIRIEPDLREVEGRRWVGNGYAELARRYLGGGTIEGWEPREEALRRVRSCIDEIIERHRGSDVAIVSHGLVLTVYLADLLGLDGSASYRIWSRLRLPDVAVLHPGQRAVEREFGWNR